MSRTPLNEAQIEAEEWFIRLQSGNIPPEEVQRFQQWYNADQSHQLEFNKAEEDWVSLGNLSQNLDIEKYKGSAPLKHRHSQTIIFRYSAIAASTLLFVGLMSVFLGGNANKTEEFITAIGEQKTVHLKDGSIVTLNTASHLEVSYQENARNLKLKKGEAYFVVAKDPSRPFSVDVNRGTVTSLGTEFNIRKTRHLATIVVTEGTVKVEETKTRTNLTPALAKVTVNEQIKFDNKGLSQVKAMQDAGLLSWKEQFFAFDQQPLEAVVLELNRYLTTPIKEISQTIKRTKVSGTFDLTQPEDALHALLLSHALTLDKNKMSIY